MKRTLFRWMAWSMLVIGNVLWPDAHAADPVPVPVVASFSILGDLVRVVGGDRVKVTTLVGPDTDAHTYTPKPAHVKALLDARLLVVNGLGFEPWALQLAQSAGYGGHTVVASTGVQPRRTQAGTDPHAWQNPLNVVLYVTNIAAGLSRTDPGGAAVYWANADAYSKLLQDLDARVRSQLDAIAPDRRRVITSHDAFGYLAARYNITMLAAEGISTDAQPGARHVADLIRQIKRQNIRAVFLENMHNPQLTEQLSRDAGITVGATLYSDALSDASGPAGTYLQMMSHNLTRLVSGMKSPTR